MAKSERNNACIPNIDWKLAAGIDPRTNLPVRMVSAMDGVLKAEIKKNLRILDEQNAVNRYVWYNLPSGLTSQLMERILYYRGQGMFFFMKETGQFYFLPYTLDGTIDVYGRYTGVTPLPFNGSVSTNDEKGMKPWITGLTKKPIYDMPLVPDLSLFEDGAVLIKDYTEQISQKVLPRQQLNEAILDIESDCLPFARTALLNSTGVTGVRVTTQDEYPNVEAASKSVNKAALTGEKYVPIVGNLEFQELTGDNRGAIQDFLMAMQSIDNFRLSLYGLPNGGLFGKNAYQNNQEVSMNQGSGRQPLEDGFKQRQQACDLINSIWGLGVCVDISESAIGLDTSGDGVAAQREDQSGTAEGEQPQPTEEGGEEQ